MVEITCYVALPFVATDDGIAAGEPTECLNLVAVVISRVRHTSMLVRLPKSTRRCIVDTGHMRPAVSVVCCFC